MRPWVLAAALSTTARTATAQPPRDFDPPRVIEARGAAPTYYRLSPHVLLPLVRLAVGMQVRAPRDAEPAPVAFAADVHAGLVRRFDRASPHGAFGEAGYSYAGFSQHLAVLGVGYLYGLSARTRPGDDPLPNSVRVAVLARALAGTSYDRFAAGLRSGVAVGYGTYALEASHQVLWVDGHDQHEFRIMLTSLLAIDEDR